MSDAPGTDPREDGFLEGCALCICRHVVDGTEPVRAILHDAPVDPDDSGWVIHCDAHEHSEEDWLIVGFSTAARYVPELTPENVTPALALPLMWEARRDEVGAPWRTSRITSVEGDS